MAYAGNVSSISRQLAVPESSAIDSVIPEAELTLRRRVHPLGFPLDLETNSQDVLEAATEGWGLFSQAFDAAPVRISLTVVESDATAQQARSHFFWREHLMSIF